jgi:hypothetical protein
VNTVSETTSQAIRIILFFRYYDFVAVLITEDRLTEDRIGQ